MIVFLILSASEIICLSGRLHQIGTKPEMDECMPHYYTITDGHGQGAEKIMWAEAALMQGQFSDTLIALETAYSQIEGNGQENMALCCDFLAQRLFLCTDIKLHYTFEQRYNALLGHHNAGPRPMVLSSLTDREHEIVMLLQQRLSNREIGEKLFLSEGSVKQYINQIYSKLHIGGDTHTKRKQLLELLSSNN